MTIQDIDKNFLQDTAYDEERTTLYDVKASPFSLHGVFFDEKRSCFMRMPVEISEKINYNVQYLSGHTAGGRIRFSTDSTSLTLVVQYERLEGMKHMALTGNSGFALCYNGDEGETFVTTLGPLWNEQTGFVRRIDLPKDKRNYTLYFPLYQSVKRVYVGVDKGAHIGEGKSYEKIAPILYYGSSITQGGCASRPDTCYQGFICKRNNVDFINMGFSGNAKAEPKMMEYLASIACSVFVYDYDHNAPSVAYLQETHYEGYKRYREKKPTTPILFVSRPDQPLDLETAARVAVVRETFERAKTEGDENVYFLDGRTLFETEWQNCTVDGCHPTDFGFYQMSLKIGRAIDEILNKNKK